jgi:hypothetical protein
LRQRKEQERGVSLDSPASISRKRGASAGFPTNPAGLVVSLAELDSAGKQNHRTSGDERNGEKSGDSELSAASFGFGARARARAVGVWGRRDRPVQLMIAGERDALGRWRRSPGLVIGAEGRHGRV